MARLFTFFILVSLGLLYAKAFGLFGRRTDSLPQIEWSLDLQAKTTLQRANLIALVVLVFFGTITQQLARGSAFFSLLAGAISLSLPMRYGFTDEGVTVNGRLLRLWTEFARYEISGRRLILRGDGRLNFLTVYLPGQSGKERDAVRFIKAHLPSKPKTARKKP